MSDIQFWTTLVRVRQATGRAADALTENCTHVTGPYWIMEGDVDCLRDEGVRLIEVAEGAVGALGDLTESELIEVCHVSYGVDLRSGGWYRPYSLSLRELAELPERKDRPHG